MKKVLVMCIAVSFIATGCDWFKDKPQDPIIVNDDTGDSGTTLIDTSVNVPDNTVVQDTNKNAGKRI